MNLTELAAAYERFRKPHDLPAMEVRHLHREPRPLADPTAAWAAFAAEQPQAGWLQFQSHVECFDQGRLPTPEPEWGGLLAAEAVAGQGRSLLLRQNGSGGLLLVIATDAAGADATVMLTDEVKVLATGRAPARRLHYRRYWQPDGELGITPVFAAFIGFVQS